MKAVPFVLVGWLLVPLFGSLFVGSQVPKARSPAPPAAAAPADEALCFREPKPVRQVGRNDEELSHAGGPFAFFPDDKRPSTRLNAPYWPWTEVMQQIQWACLANHCRIFWLVQVH
jgi:hypothetical protein